MFEIVTKLGSQFTEASNAADADALANIYSDSAKYVPNNEPLIVGNKKIRDYWAKGLQEGLRNVKLTPLSVDGNSQIIYETGWVRQSYETLQQTL